jgi:hypothetical protein
LLKNTVFGARRKFVSWFAGYGNQSAFGWVFELSMAAPSSVEIPAIFLDKLDRFADLHAPDAVAPVEFRQRGIVNSEAV